MWLTGLKLHEILHLKLHERIEKVGCQIVLKNGGKYGLQRLFRSEGETNNTNSSQPDVIGFWFWCRQPMSKRHTVWCSNTQTLMNENTKEMPNCRWLPSSVTSLNAWSEFNNKFLEWNKWKNALKEIMKCFTVTMILLNRKNGW